MNDGTTSRHPRFGANDRSPMPRVPFAAQDRPANGPGSMARLCLAAILFVFTLFPGRHACAQAPSEPDIQFAISLAPSNAPAFHSLDVPVELPGQADIHIRPPAGGWVRCTEMEFDVALPADGPTNAQVLLYIVDWEWNWYQTLAPGFLTPGRARRFRVNLRPDSEAMEPRGHHVPWHLRTLCAPIVAAIRVFGAGPFTGTCRVERVVGRSRPDPAEPPAIRNVRASAPSVPCCDKFELTFTLPDRYPNPFDPELVSVTARFEGPTGSVASVNGFYAQDYYRTLGPTGEKVESQGKPQWKVRFAPRTPGRYRYTLAAKDRAGTATWGPAEFEAVPSRNPGFVRVSRTDPRFFEFDDGSYFFPIGHNIRSPFDVRTDQQFPWKQRWPEGSSAYMRYFRDMSRNGENFVEIWTAAWSLGLEWSPISPGYHGVGQYNLRNAWEMDQVVDAADRFGLYMNVVLHNHGKFSTYVDEEWDDNPFNVARGGYLERPEEYFSDARAARDFQNLMRYMIARWGHSTRVFAWELWSELNLTGSQRVNHNAHHQPEVVDWHRAMGRWIRTVDPYRHLVTTHYSGDFRTQNPAITALPEIDHASVDAYHSDQRALRIVGLIQETAAYNNVFGKPVVITEFGGQSMAQQGFDHIDAAHHSALWASTCLTTGGTPLFWWWMLIEEESLYGRYAAIARFMRGEDRRGADKQSCVSWEAYETDKRTRATVSGGTGRIASICYGNDSEAIGWFYDQDRFEQAGDAALAPSVDLSIAVTGLRGGPYRVEFWDTKEGKVIETADAESNRGALNCAIPPFRRDMAFKVKPQFGGRREAAAP